MAKKTAAELLTIYSKIVKPLSENMYELQEARSTKNMPAAYRGVLSNFFLNLGVTLFYLVVTLLALPLGIIRNLKAQYAS